jgi:hypothetical protein
VVLRARARGVGGQPRGLPRQGAGAVSAPVHPGASLGSEPGRVDGSGQGAEARRRRGRGPVTEPGASRALPGLGTRVAATPAETGAAR